MTNKALVIGCTGQDGALLARSLLAQGLQVVGVSRSTNPNRSTLKALGIADDLHLVPADIGDFRQMLELLQANAPAEIYNLAAQSSVGLSFHQPVDTFAGIINGTINLLEVCRFLGYGGLLYFAGSSEMFGQTSTPASVATPRTPLSPYAIAKDASFNTVRLYRQAYGLNCVNGILFNHESPWRASTFVTRKIIDGAVRCSQEPGLRLKLGNLQVRRDWGWAEEYVEAMQRLLRADKLVDQLVCTGRSESLAYVVERAFSIMGLDWHDHVDEDPSLLRPSEILISRGDPEPMAIATGWRATIDVDGVVERLLQAAMQRTSN
jgi:GDPmannose 4,6-dehydratase